MLFITHKNLMIDNSVHDLLIINLRQISGNVINFCSKTLLFLGNRNFNIKIIRQIIESDIRDDSAFLEGVGL